jgi:hypothetical protein
MMFGTILAAIPRLANTCSRKPDGTTTASALLNDGSTKENDRAKNASAPPPR